MRLTVKVLPLDTLPRDRAVFKQRDFALPVRLEDSFEHVWRTIEERYKNNYLDPRHAALFTIKKLQDGWDCDIDLTDTVGAIFGDAEPENRVVKVIPSIVNRFHSMPPTTNLRPNASKRPREAVHDRANKRVRRSAQGEPPLGMSPVRDSLVRSVEAIQPPARSQSAASITLVEAAHHDLPEFTTHVKEESPELGTRPSRQVSKSPVNLQRTSPSRRLRKPSQTSYKLPPATPNGPELAATISTVSYPPPQSSTLPRRARSPLVVIPRTYLKRSSKLKYNRKESLPSQTESRRGRRQSSIPSEGKVEQLCSSWGESTPDPTSHQISQSAEDPGKIPDDGIMTRGTRHAYTMRRMFPKGINDSMEAQDRTRVLGGSTLTVSQPDLCKTKKTSNQLINKNTTSAFDSLSRDQLADELIARGLTPKFKGKRLKAEMLRRLIEYDNTKPNARVDESSQEKYREESEGASTDKAPQDEGSACGRQDSENSSLPGSPCSPQGDPSIEVSPQHPVLFNEKDEIPDAIEPLRLNVNVDQNGKSAPPPHVQGDIGNEYPRQESILLDERDKTCYTTEPYNNQFSADEVTDPSLTKTAETDLEEETAVLDQGYETRIDSNSPVPETLSAHGNVSNSIHLEPDEPSPLITQLEEAPKGTLRMNRLDERGYIRPIDKLPRLSPSLGVGYYLSGDSPVWKRNVVTASDEEAERAAAQAVEELLGAQQANKAHVSSNPKSADENKSKSESRPNSVRCSPVALRQPARWLVQSASPHPSESDEAPGSPLTPPRARSNAGSDGDPGEYQSYDNNKLDDSETEEHNYEEVGMADVYRTPTPADVDIPRLPSSPPTALSQQSIVVPSTQYSPTQPPHAVASQPPPRSAQINSELRSLLSASQPTPTSTRRFTTALAADSRRRARHSAMYTSLKTQVSNVREHLTGTRSATSERVAKFKTGDLIASSQKLPNGLTGESEDEHDETSENSSTSDDDD